jgi:hypothetical protein
MSNTTTASTPVLVEDTASNEDTTPIENLQEVEDIQEGVSKRKRTSPVIMVIRHLELGVG